MTNANENTGATEAQNNNPAPTTPGGWMRAAAYRRYVLTREYAAGLGDTARDGISDEDYATTMATLEQMARNLGWDENQGQPEWSPRGPWGARGNGHHGRGCGRGSSEHHGRGRGVKTDRAEQKAAKRAAKSAASASA